MVPPTSEHQAAVRQLPEVLVAVVSVAHLREHCGRNRLGAKYLPTRGDHLPLEVRVHEWRVRVGAKGGGPAPDRQPPRFQLDPAAGDRLYMKDFRLLVYNGARRGCERLGELHGVYARVPRLRNGRLEAAPGR